MSKTLFLPAMLEGIATRADKTIRITFGTQELSITEAGTLISMHQGMVYLAIKEELFSREEEHALDKLQANALEYQAKTPSQRLRGVLYVAFSQNPAGFSSFTTYYEHYMERLIEHFKAKLEP